MVFMTLEAREEALEQLRDILSPEKVKVSPFFHALLGAMLDEEWVDPALNRLICTSDGHILGEEAGDMGFNHYLCGISDLRRNCEGIAEAVELSDVQKDVLFSLIPQPGAPG